MGYYNERLLAIGGEAGSEVGDWLSNAAVEELVEREWKKHKMSPVNGLNKLKYFTTVSIEPNLYIFGQLKI